MIFEFKLMQYDNSLDYVVPFLIPSNLKASSGLMLWTDSDDKNKATFIKYKMMKKRIDNFSMISKC